MNDLATKKPDIVKVVYDQLVFLGNSMPTTDKATLEVVIESAKANGLATVAHVGTWQDFHDAVEAGGPGGG